MKLSEAYNKVGLYDPPYNYEKVKQYYGKDVADKLHGDSVHGWRMNSGIELIHKEPSKKELERIWKNWNLMTDEQKRKSDEESVRLFGVDNKTNYYKLRKEYQRET